VTAHDGPDTLLRQDEARHVPSGTTLYAVKGLAPANRLMGKTPKGWLFFTRHPVSNAHTLGDALMSAWKSLPDGQTLRVRSITLQSLAVRSRKLAVTTQPEVDELVIPALTAPVDWRLKPGGEAYDLALAPPRDAVFHLTYYPGPGLMILQLDLAAHGVVGIPVEAPDALRAKLDALIARLTG
jgi:hypothetical protein